MNGLPPLSGGREDPFTDSERNYLDSRVKVKITEAFAVHATPQFERLQEDMSRLRKDFNEHAKEDRAQFDQLIRLAADHKHVAETVDNLRNELHEKTDEHAGLLREVLDVLKRKKGSAIE